MMWHHLCAPALGETTTPGYSPGSPVAASVQAAMGCPKPALHKGEGHKAKSFGIYFAHMMPLVLIHTKVKIILVEKAASQPIFYLSPM